MATSCGIIIVGPLMLMLLTTRVAATVNTGATPPDAALSVEAAAGEPPVAPLVMADTTDV